MPPVSALSLQDAKAHQLKELQREAAVPEVQAEREAAVPEVQAVGCHL